MKKVIAIIVFVLGLLSGVLFFTSGANLSKSGKNLTMLSSVGGGTVAEAYYQEIGRYGIAHSFFAYAMGTGIIMVSIGFGSILILTDKKNVSSPSS